MRDVTLYPCFFYRDAPAAMAWLQRAFGFEVLLQVPGPDGTIAHGELKLGNAVLMLGSARPERGWKSPLDLGGNTQNTYVGIDDDEVEAHHARAVAAGAQVTIALHAPEYGGKTYSCVDPEGHHWSFGSYRPRA